MAGKKSNVKNPDQMRKAAAAFFGTNGKTLITASKAKQFFAEMGCRVDGTLAEALAKKYAQMMLDAAIRCAGNKRTTVRPVDL